MNTEKLHPPMAQERWIVPLLCLVAAIRVFVYSAACPFFGPVDEDFHFDLAVRYSRLNPPQKHDGFCEEALPYLVYYGSLEYAPPQPPPGGKFPPPPWAQPADQARAYLAANMDAARRVINHEAAQPPLYYLLTGLWWRIGRIADLNDAFQLYSLRFLNAFLLAASVWIGFRTARLLCPGRPLVRLGVPALLAFLPQSAFYAIQNDVLSPLCFGVVFLGMARWLQTGTLNSRQAAVIGCALAATFLTKLSNLPLLVVTAGAVAFQTWRLARAGTLRSTAPGLAVLVLCAGLPALLWLAWMKHTFGDFTGTAEKAQLLGWTHKPLADWWHHPIFTPAGLWTFISGLIGTFWQGELVWHSQPLARPSFSIVYTLLSLGFTGAVLGRLLFRTSDADRQQRRVLWLGLACLAMNVAFLGLLSIIYDFHDCVYPSREYPFFASGRLTLGAAIPFLLVFALGLDYALGWTKRAWIRPLTLAGILLFMLVGEISANWPLFLSEYNWFHM